MSQKICFKCKHFQDKHQYCQRPTGEIDLVSGTPVTISQYASDERKGIGAKKCGSGGRFFEEKVSFYKKYIKSFWEEFII